MGVAVVNVGVPSASPELPTISSVRATIEGVVEFFPDGAVVVYDSSKKVSVAHCVELLIGCDVEQDALDLTPQHWQSELQTERGTGDDGPQQGHPYNPARPRAHDE